MNLRSPFKQGKNGLLRRITVSALSITAALALAFSGVCVSRARAEELAEELIWGAMLGYLLSEEYEGDYDGYDYGYDNGYDYDYGGVYGDGYDDDYGGGYDDFGGAENSDYPVYVDEETGYIFGLYTDNTAYIAGHQQLLYNLDGAPTELTIPSEVMGYPVYAIGDNVFSGQRRVQSVVIPEGVEYIGISAFEGSGVERVSLPGTVTDIAHFAFMDTPLTELTLPEGLLYIGAMAFTGCQMHNLRIPDSVNEINAYAFFDCDELQSVQIGAGLNRMAGNVFSACPKPTDITISQSNGVIETADGVLYNRAQNSIVRYPANRRETYFEIPDGIAEIEIACFSDENALIGLRIPQSVTVIRDYALEGCVHVPYMTLPDGLTLVEDDAFGEGRTVTVAGKAGSYAQNWAASHGMTFIDGEQPLDSLAQGPTFLAGLTVSHPQYGMIIEQDQTVRPVVNVHNADSVMNWTVTCRNAGDWTVRSQNAD